jgi:hypothetical protein
LNSSGAADLEKKIVIILPIKTRGKTVFPIVVPTPIPFPYSEATILKY